MTVNKNRGLDFVSKSGSEADILIDGDIGQDSSVNAQAVKKILDGAIRSGVNKINVRIGSNGGSIFEGFRIYNALVSSPLTIHTIAESHALSMASIILQAGSKRFMFENAKVMIHSGKGGVMGSVTDILTYGNLLKDLNETLAETYSKNTGKSKSWILENWMRDGRDTWFNATDAKKNNLIDEIIEHDARSLLSSSVSYMEMAASFDSNSFRNSWTYSDWQENDPSGLDEMRHKEPARFINLVKERYGEKTANSIAARMKQDELTNFPVQEAVKKTLEDVPLGQLDTWAKENPDQFLAYCRQHYGVNSTAYKHIEQEFKKRL